MGKIQANPFNFLPQRHQNLRLLRTFIPHWEKAVACVWNNPFKDIYKIASAFAREFHLGFIPTILLLFFFKEELSLVVLLKS